MEYKYENASYSCDKARTRSELKNRSLCQTLVTLHNINYMTKE